MSGSVIDITMAMRVEECITCATPFAVTAGFQQERKRDHRNFYCPNGHTQFYPAKTKEEVERDRRVRAEQQLEQERAARAEAERKLERVKLGVCPECKRSFKNLKRHMKSKHSCEA